MLIPIIALSVGIRYRLCVFLNIWTEKILATMPDLARHQEAHSNQQAPTHSNLFYSLSVMFYEILYDSLRAFLSNGPQIICNHLFMSCGGNYSKNPIPQKLHRKPILMWMKLMIGHYPQNQWMVAAKHQMLFDFI